MPIINEESLDKDYLPEPPTPTSKACPDGGKIILQILQTCFKASSKSTKPMYALLSLYSFNPSSIIADNFSFAI